MSGSAPHRRTLVTRAATACMLAAALAAPLACHHQYDTPVSEDEQTRGPATLQVVNQGFPDMTIYVMNSGGQRLRLGLSTGTSTMTFVIPASMVNAGATQLRFIADPVGGSGASVGEQITVSPGDQLQVTIPPA